MPCPNCKTGDVSERRSFKAVTEPIRGVASTTVVVDLMKCGQCGTDFPVIRGRNKYVLVPNAKMSKLWADLEEARQTNSGVLLQLESMERRSRELSVEFERFKARAEIKAVQSEIETLESETTALQLRRDRLKAALEAVALTIRVPAR
jgi:hypothetical protein